MSKHAVPYVIGGLVTYFVEVIGLIAHASSFFFLYDTNYSLYARLLPGANAAIICITVLYCTAQKYSLYPC